MKSKIDGVLLLNKSVGMSSNAALQKVKRIYNAQKAGHTGTLDPLATGLLPICFGEATKFAAYLLEGNKEYIATIKLGEATTTYDSEGCITCSYPVAVTIDEIEKCLLKFIGEISQVPPIYSALKVNGRALYEYARNNQEVVIKSRNITIYAIELLEFSAPNIITVRVLCSKGTYIRTLANDLGVNLGCGAHLIGLIRTKTNNFTVQDSLSLEDLIPMSDDEKQACLLMPDVLVGHLSRFDLTDEQYKNHVNYGHRFDVAGTADVFLAEQENMRLYYQDRFLGVAAYNSGCISPIRLVNFN